MVTHNFQHCTELRVFRSGKGAICNNVSVYCNCRLPILIVYGNVIKEDTISLPVNFWRMWDCLSFLGSGDSSSTMVGTSGQVSHARRSEERTFKWSLFVLVGASWAVWWNLAFICWWMLKGVISLSKNNNYSSSRNSVLQYYFGHCHSQQTSACCETLAISPVSSYSILVLLFISMIGGIVTN